MIERGIDTHRLWICFFLFLACSVFWGIRLQPGWERLRKEGLEAQARQEADARSRWTESSARAVSLGHVAPWVDSLLIRTLVTGSGEVVASSLDLASRLDPAFLDLYLSGGNLLSIIYNRGADAGRLLERGRDYQEKVLPGMPQEFRARYWSATWRIPLLQGYVYLFELKDLPRAQEAFQRAASEPDAPRFLGNLARRLRERRGVYEVASRTLGVLRVQATTEQEIQKIDEKLESVRLLQWIDEVEREFLAQNKARAGKLAPPEREREWAEFLVRTGRSGRDPRGGKLFWDAKGRLRTTSPLENILGIE